MGHGYGWMQNMWGGGLFMGPWGWILILIVIGILIYLALGRGGYRSRDWPEDRRSGERSIVETPLDVLKKRYAKGEISREEFEQMKKDISL
jgi:putative membrane protein